VSWIESSHFRPTQLSRPVHFCTEYSSELSQLLRGAVRAAQPMRENVISRDRSIMQTLKVASEHGTRAKNACDAFRPCCENVGRGWDTQKQPIASGSFWPIPGLRPERRKLTLVVR